MQSQLSHSQSSTQAHTRQLGGMRASECTHDAHRRFAPVGGELCLACVVNHFGTQTFHDACSFLAFFAHTIPHNFQLPEVYPVVVGMHLLRKAHLFQHRNIHSALHSIDFSTHCCVETCTVNLAVTVRNVEAFTHSHSITLTRTLTHSLTHAHVHDQGTLDRLDSAAANAALQLISGVLLPELCHAVRSAGKNAFASFARNVMRCWEHRDSAVITVTSKVG